MKFSNKLELLYESLEELQELVWEMQTSELEFEIPVEDVLPVLLSINLVVDKQELNSLQKEDINKAMEKFLKNTPKYIDCMV